MWIRICIFGDLLDPDPYLNYGRPMDPGSVSARIRILGDPQDPDPYQHGGSSEICRKSAETLLLTFSFTFNICFLLQNEYCEKPLKTNKSLIICAGIKYGFLSFRPFWYSLDLDPDPF